MIKVGFKKLTDDAILPVKAYQTDSGLDLFVNEGAVIKPGETAVIKTGIAIKLPPGYEAQVRPRSGVTAKTKLRVQLGTIDNAYTGEVGIIVDNVAINTKERESGEWGVDVNYNLRRIDGTKSTLGTFNNDSVYEIKKGDKLAQLVIQKIPMIGTYELETVPTTARSSNGFGSTGY